MNCRDCDQLISESSIIDGVEYFTCCSCGGCIKIHLTPQSIGLDILHRKGSRNTRESFSSDFIVGKKSLLEMLPKAYGSKREWMGCFARGWDRLNDHSKDQLLLLTSPEMDSGRCLIYVLSLIHISEPTRPY